MTLKEIEKQYNKLTSDRVYVDLEYLTTQYKIKVKPYLGFIKTIRYQDGRPNEDKIKRVLGVTHGVWKQLKEFEEFRELLDLEGDYMKYEVRKKVIDLLNKENLTAKDVELGLKVFDDEYGKKGVDVAKLPERIRVDLYDARMSEEELLKKAKLEEEE